MKSLNGGLPGTYGAIFSLLKTALLQQPPSVSEDTDWTGVYAEMMKQTVAGLVGDILPWQAVDPRVVKEWKSAIIAQVQQYYRLLGAQTEMIRLLDGVGIRAVVLKGTSAAMYYPRPEYRLMGDIDFLVKPEHYEKTVQLLLQNGYMIVHEREQLERHASLTKNGVLFEVHRRFASLNDLEKAALLETMVWDSMEGAVKCELNGMSFPVLPPIQNGLVLLQHINQHLEEGVGLRQIIDWMMYVAKVLDDTLWNREFFAQAKKAGLDTLAIAVTRMCQIYLGLLEEGREWCKVAKADICEALILDIMASGNMGIKKVHTDSKIVGVMSRKYSFFGFLVHFQRVGMSNWPLARRHVIFKPFAWAYQGWHYFRHIRKGNIPVRKLKDMIREGNDRSELLDALGVRRCIKGLAVKKDDRYVLMKGR